MKAFFRTNQLWLFLFAVTDIIFIILTYLIRPEAFAGVSLFIILFSLCMVVIGYAAQKKRVKAIHTAVDKYLSDPSEDAKNTLQSVVGAPYRQLCELSFETLNCLYEESNSRQIALSDYQEYIEAWIHEIKTPLALMTLMQENHREEMSEYVFSRLDYSRQQAERDVEQILYFARLKIEHVDYNYSRFRLDDCAREVMESYLLHANEKKTELVISAASLEVLSDYKVVSFMVSQLLSNAVKYAPSEGGQITVSVMQTGGINPKICLCVTDNGSGVPAEDLPFIFDKGFTGNHPDRQKATGMGLYLVQKYANALNIEISANNLSRGNGFQATLLFPVVS